MLWSGPMAMLTWVGWLATAIWWTQTT
jgi:hypothetical protein